MVKFKYNEVSFPRNTSVINAFSCIYGISRTRALYALSSFGYSTKNSINYLNNYFFDLIIAFMKKFYIIADRLRTLNENRIAFFFELKMVKGIRLSKGLPVHGQRTHSNGNSQQNVKNKNLGIEVDNKWYTNKNKIKRSVFAFYKRHEKKTRSSFYKKRR